MHKNVTQWQRRNHSKDARDQVNAKAGIDTDFSDKQRFAMEVFVTKQIGFDITPLFYSTILTFLQVTYNFLVICMI